MKLQKLHLLLQQLGALARVPREAREGQKGTFFGEEKVSCYDFYLAENFHGGNQILFSRPLSRQSSLLTVD